MRSSESLWWFCWSLQDPARQSLIFQLSSHASVHVCGKSVKLCYQSAENAQRCAAVLSGVQLDDVKVRDQSFAS